jgi:Glycosyl transferase 4-like domain
MKRIAIVTGHFPPSNLAGVHRARLWAPYLPEFGWEPVIVTADPKYYEEILDPALLDLVSPNLRVIRTKAIPVRPIRVIGDIGVRALFWHLRALDDLIARKDIDFVLITIPSNFSALLGELLHRRHGVPFGIDYQDPWVHAWPGGDRLFGKARVSRKLADWLEPWAVKNACLITGVAPLYFEAMLERNAHLRARCVTAAMPIGHSPDDYEALRKAGRPTFLFPTDDELFHMIYAGAMLPNAYVVLERFLAALAVLRDTDREIMDRLRVHFVGTGKSPDDPQGYNIRPYVQRFGLEPWVDEHPARIGYVDVLNHLAHAAAVLVLGSTEPHYTPSKVYQSVQARRPIFALLHEQSTAVGVLRESRAGQAMTLSEDRLPDPRELAAALAAFVRDPQYSPDRVKWDAFEAYSARNSTRLLARAVDQALELSAKRSGAEVEASKPAAR